MEFENEDISIFFLQKLTYSVGQLSVTAPVSNIGMNWDRVEKILTTAVKEGQRGSPNSDH